MAAAAVGRGAGSGQRLAAMLSILQDLGRSGDAERLIRGYASEGDVDDADFAEIASAWGLAAGRGDFLEELLGKTSAGSEAHAEYLASKALMSLGSDSESNAELFEALRQSSPVRDATRRAKTAILAAMDASIRADSVSLVSLFEQARDPGATVPELLSAAFAALSVGDGYAAKRFVERAESLSQTMMGGLLRAEAFARLGESEAAIEAAIALAKRHPTRVEPLLVLVTIWSDANLVSTDTLDRIRRTTGASRSLDLADRIVDAVGMTPPVAYAYISACIASGRAERVEDAVVALMAADPPPVELMLQVHDRILGLAPSLAGLLLDRLRAVAPLDPRVIVYSVEGVLSEEDSIARLRGSLPLDDPDAVVRGEAWMAILERSRGLGDQEFQSLAAQALESAPDNLILSSRVLYDARTWRSPEFSRQVVDRIKRLRGEDSPEHLVASANWLLLNSPDDADARSMAIAALNERYLEDPDSFVVGATLLRLMISDSGVDSQPAIRLGRQLIAARPDAVELYPIVISLMQAQGMLGESERLLAEFERIDRQGGASARQRALASFQRGNFDELVRSLSKVSQASDDASDLLALGVASEVNGDLPRAEAAYRQALNDDATAAEALVRLGQVLRRTGRIDEFETILEERGGSLTEVQREIAVAEIMLSGGDRQGALARLQDLSGRHAGDPAVWIALALSHAASDDARAAGDAAVRGLLVEPSSIKLQSLAMVAAIEDAAWGETAILSADRAARLPAPLVESVRLLRATRGENGRLAPDGNQLRASRELCSRFGDSLNVWRLAAALHRSAGQLAESKSISEAAARRFPDEPDPMEWQVIAASSLGDLDQASSLCIEWRRLSFPDVRRVDEAQAAIELARNRPEAALPLLARHRDLIVSDASARPGPYRALIASLLMVGKVAEAAELERTNLASSPASRTTWAQIAGMAPYERGLEAMSVLEAATPADSGSRAQMVGRWVAFHERHPNGRGLERARALLPRLAASPNDAESRLAMVARSDIERASGDIAAAKASLKSVIDSYPPDIQDRARSVASLTGPDQFALFQEIEALLYARNNLAMLLVGAGESPDQALSLVEQCIEILPTNPDLRDTEAQVLLSLGRLSEAEQSSVMAIRAYPQNASVLLTGVEILAASGRKEDARQILQRVREIISREPWPSQQVADRLRLVSRDLESED
ncbi:MAG: tetratricopeptide repeat protein [Phycisphaerales bacterium]